jgi:hypothetical protein
LEEIVIIRRSGAAKRWLKVLALISPQLYKEPGCNYVLGNGGVSAFVYPFDQADEKDLRELIEGKR